MQTHDAVKIAIVAEKLIQKQIIAIMEAAGATGYSVFEGDGRGAQGPHPVHRPSMVVNEFAIVKIESVVASRETADKIAEEVSTRFFETHPCIVYLSAVEVLRPSKF
ncbi:MAG: hypothetical protein AAF360_18200 [Pseudomonadota bacterium]